MILRAARWRRREDRRDQLMLAWRVGRYVGFSRMPDPQDEIDLMEGRTAAPMTADEIMAAMDSWDAVYHAEQAAAARLAGPSGSGAPKA